MNEDILTKSLPDGGPLYRETNLNAFIAEPWNAGSSVVFILIAFYLIWKTQRIKTLPLLLKIAPVILLIGGIGGTLYHAFRVSSFFLFLDVAPIYTLVFGVACAFWIRWTGKPVLLLGILPFFILMDLLIFYVFPLDEQIKQHLSYVNMAAAAVIPLAGMLVREKFRMAHVAVLALLGYGTGLTCRVLDAMEPPVMAVGTHWLWHVICAFSSLLLMEFMIRFFVQPRPARVVSL